MAKELKQNVHVDGFGWFGPDYPDNKPSAEALDKIGDHAFSDPDEFEPDLRMRIDDGLEPIGEDEPAPTRRGAKASADNG